jgi:hypothetical protein
MLIIGNREQYNPTRRPNPEHSNSPDFQPLRRIFVVYIIANRNEQLIAKRELTPSIVPAVDELSIFRIRARAPERERNSECVFGARLA